MLSSMLFTERKMGEALQVIRDNAPKPGQALFIAVGEKCSFKIEGFIAALRGMECPFFGGVFPGVIWGGRRYDRGMVVSLVPVACPPILIRDLRHGGIPAVVRETGAAQQDMTAMVVVDGLAPGISDFLGRLNRELGNPGARMFGGGAGSLSMEQAPCVFTQDGIFLDAAAVAMIPKKCRMGIQHGWEILRGPYTATRTQGNVILEVDGRPAFPVYRDVVEHDAKRAFNSKDFYALSMKYPLGLGSNGAEMIVRDPLKHTPEDGLFCCGDVPEGAVFHILRGDPGKLLDAADSAARACVSKAFGVSVSRAFIVDCVSRMLFLQNMFERELDLINRQLTFAVGGPEPLGMLTLGEIASRGQDTPQLFNKTTVLSMLLE